LKAGVWFRRARFFIFAPDSQAKHACRQAAFPLNALFKIPEPPLWTGVRDMFNNHPDVRDYVFQKVRDYNENTRPGEKWHRELEANPNFANRYRQNRNIINDFNLASEEPEINQFLRTNPDVRDYLETCFSILKIDSGPGASMPIQKSGVANYGKLET
jgi:hypothetical protein